MAGLTVYLSALLLRSPGLGVAVMLNNYLHDMATGLLVGSGFALHALMRLEASHRTPEGSLFFLRVNRRMVQLFRFALWWVVLGGVPRTIFYTSFEWANAADKMQVPALLAKHVLMAAALVWGVTSWRRMQQRVGELFDSLPAELRGRLEAR